MHIVDFSGYLREWLVHGVSCRHLTIVVVVVVVVDSTGTALCTRRPGGVTRKRPPSCAARGRKSTPSTGPASRRFTFAARTVTTKLAASYFGQTPIRTPRITCENYYYYFLTPLNNLNSTNIVTVWRYSAAHQRALRSRGSHAHPR